MKKKFITLALSISTLPIMAGGIFSRGYQTNQITSITDPIQLPDAQIITERINTITQCSSLMNQANLDQANFVATFANKELSPQEIAITLNKLFDTAWNESRIRIPILYHEIALKQINAQKKVLKPLLFSILLPNFPDKIQDIIEKSV